MLPNQILSTVAVAGTYLAPDEQMPGDLEDWELGGIALNDPSAGLQYQTWHCFMDGDNVMLEAPSVAPTVMVTIPDLRQLSFTFDQNMNFILTYTIESNGFLRWFDTALGAYTTTTYINISTPRVSLDDKRQTQTNSSDVIFVYVKDNNLYFRAQRDRYLVEYLLRPAVGALIQQFGMSDRNRMQFRMKPIL